MEEEKMEKILGQPKMVRLELEDTFPPFIPTPIQELPAAISNWQALTPLLTIQEETEAPTQLVLSPPSLGNLSIRSPGPPDTASPPVLRHDVVASPSHSLHSNIIIKPQYNSLGSTVSPGPVSPQHNPSTVLFDPEPPVPRLSPAPAQYYGSSPQPRQVHSPFLQPPGPRSRSVSPAVTETNLTTDLIDIDITDLLGANNYGTNNIVTDGHKPQIRRQSKEKFAQGKTKTKENAIEEKMSNLSL